jgi:hypothetical protein
MINNELREWAISEDARRYSYGFADATEYGGFSFTFPPWATGTLPEHLARMVRGLAGIIVYELPEGVIQEVRLYEDADELDAEIMAIHRDGTWSRQPTVIPN